MAGLDWVDALVGDKVVGYVYRSTYSSVWVCMLETDGKSAVNIGTARNQRAALDKVVAAYLRT